MIPFSFRAAYSSSVLPRIPLYTASSLAPRSCAGTGSRKGVLDILKGAFASGARYLSFYSGNSDLVRVTGYLVKKSDLEKFEREEMTLNEATVNGSVVNKNLHLLDRKVRGEQ